MNNNIEEFYEEHDDYRDTLATVDKDGKRIWVYPKKPKGKFYEYRKLVSYVLLLVLFGLPWIKLNGQPFFLLNILQGDFILFGIHFTTHDFHLFVVGMLIALIFIALFTVAFGRLFCGWICPQTIFMEMLYRRIEYFIEGDANAQKKLNKAPWTVNKIWKKGLKQILFFGIAVAIANTFLAYFIGSDEVLNIIREPITAHFSGFISMIVFSFVFYFVFASLREQVCTTICPYGRLQGVLLDDQSLAVYYDHKRGEPRGRMKKNEVSQDTGDCIACNLCVKVCPTGIDIRDGIQLECINCTACMDACDEVMTKIDRPTSLIRIDSLEGITTGKRSIINKRTLAYSAILLCLITLESFLFMNRSQVEVLLLRTPGTLYFERVENKISNLYNYQLINKTEEDMPIRFKIKNFDATIEYIGAEVNVAKNSKAEGALFIDIPEDQLKGRKNKLKIEVRANGELIDEIKTTFLGPIK